MRKPDGLGLRCGALLVARQLEWERLQRLRWSGSCTGRCRTPIPRAGDRGAAREQGAEAGMSLPKRSRRRCRRHRVLALTARAGQGMVARSGNRTAPSPVAVAEASSDAPDLADCWPAQPPLPPRSRGRRPAADGGAAGAGQVSYRQPTALDPAADGRGGGRRCTDRYRLWASQRAIGGGRPSARPNHRRPAGSSAGNPPTGEATMGHRASSSSTSSASSAANDGGTTGALKRVGDRPPAGSTQSALPLHDLAASTLPAVAGSRPECSCAPLEVRGIKAVKWSLGRSPRHTCRDTSAARRIGGPQGSRRLQYADA